MQGLPPIGAKVEVQHLMHNINTLGTFVTPFRGNVLSHNTKNGSYSIHWEDGSVTAEVFPPTGDGSALEVWTLAGEFDGAGKTDLKRKGSTMALAWSWTVVEKRKNDAAGGLGRALDAAFKCSGLCEHGQPILWASAALLLCCSAALLLCCSAALLPLLPLLLCCSAALLR